MQLNLSTDIALRTLIYLGQKGAPATIAEVADAFGIVKTHLMKIVMDMVAADLLVSERGRNGGIRLARAAEEISIGEVVRLMEKMEIVICMKESAKNVVCPLLPKCRLKSLFLDAQSAFLSTLDASSLADLLPVSMSKRTR